MVAAVAALGGHFDCASRGEIDLCLSLGVAPRAASPSATPSSAPPTSPTPTPWACEQFAADAEEELHKIAEHAPGARVIVRMLVEASEADWPLSRKFGCSRREALRLMDLGRCLGLDVAGISFHAGSQMREPAMWALRARRRARALDRGGARRATRLRILNIGGGFPAFYGQPLPATEDYAAEVMRMVRAPLRRGASQVMAEPGRGLVAEAGVIVAEVVLVARKDQDDLARWVYLDIGKFSGLAETIDEAIRYQFETRHGDGDDRPLHPGRPVLQLGRRALREAPGPAAARRSRPATRCASSAPAPTRRATRRSASTASRRSTPSSSADAAPAGGLRRGGPAAHRADHRPAPDRRAALPAATTRRRRSPRCWRAVAALDPRPDVVLLTGDLAENGTARGVRRLRASRSPASTLPMAAIPGNHDRRGAFAAGLAGGGDRDRRRAGPAARGRGRARCG